MVKKEEAKTKSAMILGKELELDADVIEKLTKIQEDYQKRFKDKIEKARAAALAGYNARIELLKKAKIEALNQYNEEIKIFENLVKSLESKKVVIKKRYKKKK